MSELLITNGTVVTATEQVAADVHIVGEKIQAISPGLKARLQLADSQVIDAQGCYVFPGGIDPHTHMDLPLAETCSSDSFETGSLAALHGGTTTIIDFANQIRGGTLAHALELWHQKAGGNCHCDYAFHVSVTDFNERTRAEIRECIERQGITSFKTFMAYKGRMMIDDRQMIEVMELVRDAGGIVLVHAENGDLIDHLIARNQALKNLTPRFHALSRPPVAEAEAVSRIVDLARFVGCPLYIVHLSSELALSRIRVALSASQRAAPGQEQPPLFVETCPQYLLLNASSYSDDFESAKYVLSPPLRGVKDQRALWSGLTRNIISTVATDHCPFNLAQRELGRGDFSRIPNGVPGVEHRLELLYSEGVEKGKLSLQQFVKLTSTNAARIFGLYPRKGELAPGSDADIVIFDPNATHRLSAKTHHMRCDNSIYEGRRVKGKCRITILRGTVAVNEGKACVSRGFGVFLNRGRPLFPGQEPGSFQASP